jgi:uncharacterized membrane protein YgcG
MSTEHTAASVPAVEDDLDARGNGRRQIAIVAAVAVAVALAAFLVGRLGGSNEKTVHVKQGAKSHSLVVVPKTSPRVTPLATASIAPLVSPPAQAASSGGSTSSSSGGNSSSSSSSSGGTSSSSGSSSGGGVIVGGG